MFATGAVQATTHAAPSPGSSAPSRASSSETPRSKSDCGGEEFKGSRVNRHRWDGPSFPHRPYHSGCVGGSIFLAVNRAFAPRRFHHMTDLRIAEINRHVSRIFDQLGDDALGIGI